MTRRFTASTSAERAYKLIKLKLGSGDWRTDWRLVKIAREETAAPLCVDANGGWSVDDSLAIIPRLAEMGIVFVEQLIAKDNLAGWRTLRESLPGKHPPLIADESVQGVESVPPLVGIADGINVKLAKCGGLRPARQMILLTRAYGMKVMIGCMVESSVAVTAAAQLAPLADFADLDGNLLITNDPYRGLRVDAGRVTLPDAPGLGVKPHHEISE
jgi:L-alanine-DL-glutamate epimerase-like enolase superfamily enzyme